MKKVIGVKHDLLVHLSLAARTCHSKVQALLLPKALFEGSDAVSGM